MKPPLFLIALACIFGAASTFGSDHVCEAEAPSLLSRAEALNSAYQRSDGAAIAEMTHRSVIRQAGGRANMTELTKTSLEKLKAKGIQFEQVKLQPPTRTYLAGAEYVCFIPRESVISSPKWRVRELGFFVAVRDAAPNSLWTFFDSAGLKGNPEVLWQLLPDLPRDAELPPNTIAPLR